MLFLLYVRRKFELAWSYLVSCQLLDNKVCSFALSPFPVFNLFYRSLQIYSGYYGDSLKVECPTESGHFLTLAEVAEELSYRLIKIFAKNDEGTFCRYTRNYLLNLFAGKRPVFANNKYFNGKQHWNKCIIHFHPFFFFFYVAVIPFYEYCHGDSGAGLGASHQTGWMGLVAALIEEFGMRKAACPK
jgi:hypothetical protein